MVEEQRKRGRPLGQGEGRDAEKGFSPETIAAKTNLPQSLVEEILAASLVGTGGGGR